MESYQVMLETVKYQERRTVTYVYQYLKVTDDIV